ncbi:hypothetical protein PHLCEN_2v10217 [Hermanssonia centrifuga]|uniref:Uncharacterized protein n=1 Tax=Hermanssonia centrifuga TaxID=98765 RepID=A0A2R6NPG4_9APHY|nr:hypothetical protein PHLCEN_2v10217 [Hermanssonia centrifuga]
MTTALQGMRRLARRLEVPHNDDLSYSEMFLTNDDLLPVPPEKRAWKAWNFVAL